MYGVNMSLLISLPSFQVHFDRCNFDHGFSITRSISLTHFTGKNPDLLTAGVPMAPSCWFLRLFQRTLGVFFWLKLWRLPTLDQARDGPVFFLGKGCYIISILWWNEMVKLGYVFRFFPEMYFLKWWHGILLQWSWSTFLCQSWF